MGSKARFGSAAAALVLTLAGCGEGELPGHYWDVELSLLEDACNASPVGYNESLEYRVAYDLDDIEVAVGPDVFATGTSSGCEVSYSTITWTEPRRDGDVQWQLRGSAKVQQGSGGGCAIQDPIAACPNVPAFAADWRGCEVFTIVSSEDPNVNPGCTYTLQLSGTYVGEVE